MGEFNEPNLDELGAIARSIGWGTAQILQVYSQGTDADLAVQNTVDGPVTAADLAASDYILQQFRIALGSESFCYLTEETYKRQPQPNLHLCPWVWIIDPIDGTGDFIDRTGEYAIHIALVHQGRPVLAVVVWPAAEKLYYAQRGKGTFVETPDGQRKFLRVSQRDRPEEFSILVSRSHRNQRFNHLLKLLPYQRQKHIGSIGCKIALMVEQQADAYLYLSGKTAAKDWDMAAPELILTEAGGQFSHADGSPVLYNQKDVNQWGCLIGSNGQCHDFLCQAAEQILADIDRQIESQASQIKVQNSEFEMTN